MWGFSTGVGGQVMVMGKGGVIRGMLGRYSVESVLRQVGYLKFWWLVWPLVKEEASAGAEGHGARQLSVEFEELRERGSSRVLCLSRVLVAFLASGGAEGFPPDLWAGI